MYDTDRSGDIDFTEFMILYHIMNDGSPEEVVNFFYIKVLLNIFLRFLRRSSECLI